VPLRRALNVLLIRSNRFMISNNGLCCAMDFFAPWCLIGLTRTLAGFAETLCPKTKNRSAALSTGGAPPR
jgi:hypothetical protein